MSPITTLVAIKKLVQKHYPYPWAKDHNILWNWILWYADSSFLVCVADGKKIVSLAICRPVMKPEDGLQDYVFDHEGPVIYVDFFYAANNEAFRGLIVAATQRFGVRQTLAFQRQDKQGKNRLHAISMQHFVLHVLKELRDVTT